MSRLNLESLNTLPLLDPIVSSSPAENSAAGDDLFGALLQRARSALNEPSPAASHAKDPDGQCRHTFEDHRTTEGGNAPQNHRHKCSSPDDTPDANGVANQPESPAPSTEPPNQPEATQAGDPERPTDSKDGEQAVQDQADSPENASEQVESNSTDASTVDPVREVPSTDDPEDENGTEDELKRDGEAAVMAVAVPIVDTMPAPELQATGTEPVSEPPAAVEPPILTPDAPSEAGAEGTAGEPLEPATEGQSSATAKTGKPQDAQGKPETGEIPPVPVPETQGKRPKGDSEHSDRGDDGNFHENEAGKRGRAVANRPVARTPSTEAAVTPLQNHPQVPATPQPMVAQVQVADAAVAAALDNTAQPQDSRDDSQTSEVGGVQRAAEGRTSPSSGTQPSPDSPEVSQADRVRFVQRVARAFESVGERGGSIRLKLHPPELGALRLEVTLRNGVMSARLEAETQTAQSMLLEHLPALRERLAEQNIRVERFDVDLTGQSQGGSTDGADAQARSRQGHQQNHPHYGSRTEAGTERVAGLRRSVTTGSSSQFDVII